MGRRAKRKESRKVQKQLHALVTADFDGYNKMICENLLPDDMPLVDISDEVRTEFVRRVPMAQLEKTRTTKNKHCRLAEAKRSVCT